MPQIPAIGLVVVKGGVAELFSPSHVDLRLVDIDDIKAGDEKVTLPMWIGFEKLVSDADIQEYVTFDLEPWQDHPDFPASDWQQEVAAGNTQRGYAEWVKAQIEDQASGKGE
ncbi:MAG: hypothetical protein WC455_09200 [Dehalococcoidia bacterium]|jgi:hypothetical protein